MSVERLAELMQERRPCVVLTGAGISTESRHPGLPLAAGIWAEYDPMEYATIDAFLARPGEGVGLLRQAARVLGSAEPNDGHRALAELEERGWVRAVITQNIDRLHERAGSRALVEVHGSIRTSSCLDCGPSCRFADVAALLPVPACPAAARSSSPTSSCSASSCRRPRSRGRTSSPRRPGCCSSSARRSRSIPSPGLPLETIAAGGALAIVNRGETPFDSRAAVTIDAGAGETLRALAERYPSARSDAAKMPSRKRPFTGDVASANTGTTRSPANETEK